jgi:hypothetical protein
MNLAPHRAKLPFCDQPAASSPQSFSSPVSGGLLDRELMVNAQIRKLAEMRKSQMVFFDSKMGALKEAESRIVKRAEEMKKREENLIEKERELSHTKELIRAETDELVAIRELLKVENESVQMRMRDLKRLVKKYEASLLDGFTNTVGKGALLERLQIPRPQ